MKIFTNFFFAFMLTFCLWTGIKEWAVSETAIRLTHWVYRIDFWHQVFFWWVVFTFPSTTSRLLHLLGNGITKGLTCTVQGAGQTLQAAWRYRAGKVAIGAGVLYVLYYYFLHP